MTTPGAAETAELQERLIRFIRGFGLLQPGATPCGQPLAVSAAHALLELGRDTGLSQRDLCERLQLEKSTVSRLVSQVAAKGWVVRLPDPDDRRGVHLHLTESGRNLAARIADARASHVGTLLALIPDAERAGVVHALDVLVAALDRQRR